MLLWGPERRSCSCGRKIRFCRLSWHSLLSSAWWCRGGVDQDGTKAETRKILPCGIFGTWQQCWLFLTKFYTLNSSFFIHILTFKLYFGAIQIIRDTFSALFSPPPPPMWHDLITLTSEITKKNCHVTFLLKMSEQKPKLKMCDYYSLLWCK
jgi:hypothetical protein